MTALVRLDPIERAIADIAAGKAVVVVDDEDRENEGDIVFAAAKATPALLAFTIRFTSGVVCVPMMEGRGASGPAQAATEVSPAVNEDRKRTAYAVSVDARDGIEHRHLGRRPSAHDQGAGRLGHRALRA